MINYLMKRPIAVTMILVAIMVIGMIGIRNMPVSLMPDMDVPQVTVQAKNIRSEERRVGKECI